MPITVYGPPIIHQRVFRIAYALIDTLRAMSLAGMRLVRSSSPETAGTNAPHWCGDGLCDSIPAFEHAISNIRRCFYWYGTKNA